MLAPLFNHLRCRRAFSLFEISVALVLVGLFSGLLMQFVSGSGKAKCYEETRAKIERVRDAVNRYAQSNDRFPMPARRILPTDSPEFGKEVPVDTAAFPSDGISPDLDKFTNADGTIVVFGAVPFSTLSITRDDAVDCWGNKLSYVVTKDLTVKATFDNSTLGAFEIKTDWASPTPFLAETGFAIISHGADELGAVKENDGKPGSGTNPRKWCDPATPLLPADTATAGKRANCAANGKTLLSRAFGDGKDAKAEFFDDIIAYRGKPWTMGESNVYCWGRNTNGAVGAGDWASHFSPTLVTGGVTFKDISAGNGSACGVSNDGKAYCWGENNFGKIALPSSTPRVNVPTKIDISTMHPSTSGKYINISTRANVACGVTLNKHVYCWGSNGIPPSGVVGDIGTSAFHSPNFIGAGPYSKVVSGGHFACALTEGSPGGYILCWGAAPRGELGSATGSTGSPTPIDLPGMLFKDVTLGDTNGGRGIGCGLTLGEELYCWGEGYGSPPTYAPIPVDVSALPADHKTFYKVAGGIGRINNPNLCALTTDGTAYCWGGTRYITPTLVDVSTLPLSDRQFVDIKVGDASWSPANYICALTSSGKEYCWGVPGGPGDVMSAPVAIAGTGAPPLIFSTISVGGDSFGNLACAIVGTPPPIGGGWTNWSACTGACGPYAGTKTRSCTLAAPATCTGVSTAPCTAC